MTGGVLDDTADEVMDNTADDIVDDTVEISDEELAELALAADPNAPIDDDAVPFGGDPARFLLLPEWYMPAPGIRRSRRRAVVMLALAASLVIINIGGFCVTYGFPEFVWRSP